MMLWRHILAALHDPDAARREQLLAVGAAALAHARRTDDHPADAETVCRIALEEFGILLDAATAAAALAERRVPGGRQHEVPLPNTRAGRRASRAHCLPGPPTLPR
ncbi:hypothetical protein [Streptomyces sp. NPDC012825]|uniref:hypothetical protein n=1 Tax=Streptomyces sp. NPDC012825 TaxID=3364851 RepID=UPI0036A24BE6